MSGLGLVPRLGDVTVDDGVMARRRLHPMVMIVGQQARSFQVGSLRMAIRSQCCIISQHFMSDPCGSATVDDVDDMEKVEDDVAFQVMSGPWRRT
jgi:hypothetical protein